MNSASAAGFRVRPRIEAWTRRIKLAVSNSVSKTHHVLDQSLTVIRNGAFAVGWQAIEQACDHLRESHITLRKTKAAAVVLDILQVFQELALQFVRV
jgi:hypothetical protein